MGPNKDNWCERDVLDTIDRLKNFQSMEAELARLKGEGSDVQTVLKTKLKEAAEVNT